MVVMFRSRCFFSSAVLFLMCLAGTVLAQQAAVGRFVEHVSSGVESANRLMESGQVEEAVAALNDVNRYIESTVNHDLEDQLFAARKENRSFAFNLQVSLAGGFSADFWKRKYDQANTSMRLAREAISGIGSIRVLDRQDEALVYAKTIYDSVVTIKDVVSNVKTQSYLQAIKDAKEGIDGFIENYKAIEEAKFKKQQTDDLEMQMNGLVRRANRVINSVEPVLSFMKANAEEADRFNNLLERVQAVKQKVFSGVAQKMVYGDHRYTWNYEPFTREVKELVTRVKTEKMAKSAAEGEFAKITASARASWQQVCKNVADSDDEEQKPMMVAANDKQWADYDKFSREMQNEALAAITENRAPGKKSPGVNLFAGSSEAAGKSSADKQPEKPNLFVGADAGDVEDEDDREETEEITEQGKVNMFAGLDADSRQGKPAEPQKKPAADHADKPVRKPADAKSAAAKKLGEIYNTGTGDTSTHVGGNYVTVPLSDLAEDDVIEVEITSGSLKFVHVHLRNSRGVWLSVYNGTNTLFRAGNLLKNSDWSAFTHFIFSINSQHTKNLPLACRANLLLHNAGSIDEKTAERFAAQWRSGSGEIPNEYVQQRPNLVYKGQKPEITQNIAGRQAPPPTSSSQQKGAAQSTSQPTGNSGNSVSGATDDKLALANQVNAIIRRADEEFNKKYWNEKTPPQTTQQAINSKAACLKILREAMKVSDGANLPENKIFLNKLIAGKLTEYARRVFEYVGKAEFHAEAAALIKKTGDLIGKVDSGKVTVSFLYSDLGDLWRELGKVALVGKHAYNKNECFQLEQAAYERALSVYPQNHKAKKALNR